jgi:ADP-ribose pyrophosphatase YjhB (NUDIX family)
MSSTWLDFQQRIQAIAQSGLTYSENVYDRERYEQLRDLALEMAACYTDTEPQLVRDLFKNESGYTTPKVDVRGVVFRDGRILLVQEKVDSQWTLPGGWADVGDSPSEAIVREIHEEAGFEARAVKLLAVYDRQRQGHPVAPHYTYKLFFRCEITGGVARTNHETLAVDFFALDDLPPLSAPRVTESQIRRMFDHLHDPNLPTDFD